MKYKLAIAVAVIFILGLAGSLYAQSMDVRCIDGTLVTAPIQGGLNLSCIAFTPTPLPTATNTPLPTATNTPLPTSTNTPLPTSTNTPVPTVVLPTITPTPLPTATPVSTPSGPLAAFPGAEGYGAEARGGRGGTVYLVTNLNDSGAGSFRECATASGPRICVFRVGGTILLNSSIVVTNPFLTVAGQTAPGGGITLRAADEQVEAAFTVKTKEVIVQYMRFRPGTIRQNQHVVGINAGGNAVGEDAAYNVIFDHVSISWGADEILILYGHSHHITVQWSNISESLPAPLDGSVGIKGIILGFDNGPGLYSLHHNLIAHNNQRNPNADVDGTIDFVNNVVYNWRFSGANLKLSPEVNLVSNYVKPGPNTDNNNPFVKLTSFTGSYYLQNNHVDGQIKTVDFAPGTGVASRFSAPQVTTDTPQNAYTRVLAEAGASRGLNCDGSWFMRRDAVDVRIAQSVLDGTPGHNIPKAQTLNGFGYITTPADVGGWPVLAAGTPCTDSDNDGMPNIWEQAQGLNVNVNDSSGDINGNGYTNIEDYINGQEVSGSALQSSMEQFRMTLPVVLGK